MRHKPQYALLAVGLCGVRVAAGWPRIHTLPVGVACLRAAVRAADPWTATGRLVRVLDSNAFFLLRDVPATDTSLHTLRRLIDTLAAAAA
ncbi:hypothetical protein [Streptomyces sp. NPDC055109]